jgi:hypothetical protein
LGSLLNNIKICNRFITNSWGIIRHQSETLGASQDDVPDSAIIEIY